MPNNQKLITEQYNFCTNNKLETITEKFVWTIENFSEHPDIKRGKYLQSTEFNSAAPNYKLLKWRMTFSVSDNCISLYIYPINYEDDKMKAKYQFSIRKPDGREFKFKIIDLNYCGYGSWCWSETKMKMEDLFNEENGYLNGGRLRIECTLTFQQKSIKFEMPDEVPECRVIQENLGHLFEKSLFWDCKIISADDKKFKVHKCILGCRSPVFGAMFQHKMTENNDNIIDIVDIKGDVIEQMIHFIYSGKEPDFGEMVEDLLFAADKYEINGLKLLCENKLIYSLGSENACELFSLANLYSAEQLKAHAIGFIKMHLNEVMESKGWKTLADEQLKNQILKAIAK